LKLWSAVRMGAWLLAGVAVLALWVLVLLADAYSFLVSYTRPLGAYTGQDGDRAMSWVLLGLLVAASALAIAVVRLPVSYRRLRASARSDGQGVKEWLASQQLWPLARALMTFNTPIMIVTAVVAVLTAIATSYHRAPAGALLWAAAAGTAAAASVTALEVFLFRRAGD
jgi:multisubunit Na+/H+ antiporter MnhG subunit